MKPPRDKFGGTRLWLNTHEIDEQIKALSECFQTIVPNLRSKHIGAALRRIGTKHINPIYRQEALKFEKGIGYKKTYKTTTSEKTGRTQRRKQAGSLRKSVGTSKVFFGYPNPNAISAKSGFRMGRYGGSHAMLLARGTKDRYRRVGNMSQVLKRAAAIHKAARQGVQFVGRKSRKPVSARKLANAIMQQGKAGYCGKLKATQLANSTGIKSKQVGGILLVEELEHAFRQAYKEQFSQKYRAVMAKYMQKYHQSPGTFYGTNGFFNKTY